MNENNTPDTPAPQPINTAKVIRTGWWVLAASLAATLIPLYFGYVHIIGILIATFSLRSGVAVKNIPLIVVSAIFVVGGLLFYFLVPKE